MTVYANKPAFNIREKLKELDKPIGTLAYQNANAPIINSLTITDNTSSVAAAFPNPMLLLRGQYPYLVFQDTDTVTPGSTSTLHGHQSGTIFYDANNPNSANISGGHSFRINGATKTVMILDVNGMDLLDGRIKFPATQNASTNANTLDDYEEGTWTPSLGGITGASYGYQLGSYTKIGNMVYCFWDMSLSSFSGTFNGNLNGFPFVVSSSLGGYSVLHHRDASCMNSVYADGQLKGFAQQGSSFGVYQIDRSGTSSFATASSYTPTLTSGRSTGYVIYQAA